MEYMNEYSRWLENATADEDLFKELNAMDAKTIEDSFYYEVLDVANRVRPYDIDFGILPAPKYDEAQENYICNANGWCVSPVVVPKIVEAPDRVGFVIEAIAEISKQYILSSIIAKNRSSFEKAIDKTLKGVPG